MMSLGPSKDDSRTTSGLKKQRETRERNTALISGTPALYLTHGEVIEAKKARIEREAQNVIEKENARKMKETQKRVALEQKLAKSCHCRKKRALHALKEANKARRAVKNARRLQQGNIES